MKLPVLILIVILLILCVISINTKSDFHGYENSQIIMATILPYQPCHWQRCMECTGFSIFRKCEWVYQCKRTKTIYCE